MGNLVKQIDGINISPLKIINGNEGFIMHALKKNETDFNEFGEAYFSSVNYKSIKGWKKHTKMISNLIVPIGEIRFVFFDDRLGSITKGMFLEVYLKKENYSRLCVQPGIWMAFQGMSKNLNVLLNISSILHDPNETIIEPIKTSKIIFKF